jgi:hypothetical protein
MCFTWVHKYDSIACTDNNGNAGHIVVRAGATVLWMIFSAMGRIDWDLYANPDANVRSAARARKRILFEVFCRSDILSFVL